MQLTRDSLTLQQALLQSTLDLRTHLPDAQVDQKAQGCERRQDAKRTEPGRLVPSRCDHEIHCCVRGVQYAVFVRRSHLEAVGPRAKVRVERLPSRTAILPVVIDAAQFVAETRALRHC